MRAAPCIVQPLAVPSARYLSTGAISMEKNKPILRMSSVAVLLVLAMFGLAMLLVIMTTTSIIRQQEESFIDHVDITGSSDHVLHYHDTTTTTTAIHASSGTTTSATAEISVSAGGELIAQSPGLDFVITSIMKPALVEAALTLMIHSLGIPIIVTVSKRLAPYHLSHAGWTMRNRFVGSVGRYFKRIHNIQRRSKPIVSRKAWTGGWEARRIVVSASQKNTKKVGGVVRLWDSTKKAVRHVYRKRSRYSVASEFTNLIQPEPKEKENDDTRD